MSLLEQADIDRELIKRRGLHEFVRRAWHLVEPSVKFVDNWHLPVVCHHIEACIAGYTEQDRRLICNQPPGTCKSLIFAVFLPAWIWTIWPGFCSIYASFDPQISLRDAKRTLMILESPWYRERWPHVKLRDAKPAVGEFYNTSGGFRFATSVESNVTGFHAHLRVVDDPIKPLDTMGGSASTATQIKKVIDWWDGTMSSRNKDPKMARYAIIMQRLHEDDLAGYLLKKDEGRVTHLRLPMRYDAENRCWNENVGCGDARTEHGQLLWPERYDEVAVAQLERDLGPHGPAQLQQEPTNPDGEIFKRENFRFYDSVGDLPKFFSLTLTVDCSFKNTAGSDFVAMQLWGNRGPNSYLVWADCERRTFTETLAQIKRVLAGGVPCLIKDYRVGAKLIEDKANGTAVMNVLEKEVHGLIPILPEGGKVARANAVSYLHRAGNVYYPNPKTLDVPWCTQHMNQMLGFPKAKHDDSVDAETQYLGWQYVSGSNLWAAMEAHKARKEAEAEKLVVEPGCGIWLPG